MIKISPVYNKFKVTFSNPGSGERGYSIMAKNLDEVFILINHYHGRPHNKAKCPFCQSIPLTKKTKEV